MGEIFERERSATELGFTGERLTGTMQGQIEIEHLHRYFLARQASRGLDVLDIACGEGYGSALLAQVARSVVGVDVSDEAVGFARQSYRRDNLRFLTGDGRAIPLGDASVDVVASFETLEHLYEQEQFLAECRRVLRPGGLLLISTPDREVYSPDGSTANRFHVRELDLAEFHAALAPHFPHVGMFRQRPMLGSAILPLAPDSAARPAITFEQRGRDTFEANAGLPRALYLLAYCSDRPVAPPSASLYIETSQIELRAAEAARQQEALRVEAANRAAELAAARLRHAAELAAERSRHAAALDTEERRHAGELASALAAAHESHAQRMAVQAAAVAAMQEDHARQLAAECSHAAAAHARVGAIEASTIWRATGPLRAALSAAPGIRRLGRRGAKLAWWSLTFQLPDRLRQRRQIQALIAEAAAAPPAPPAPIPEPLPEPAPAPLPDPLPARTTLSPVALRVQQRALGSLLAPPRLAITIGLVTYDNDPAELARCIASARLALAQVDGPGRILAIDNGRPTPPTEGVEWLPSAGNIGFGAAHNRLMQAAFAGGAELYVAVNPDGAFFPDCLAAIARMHAAHAGQALIEACQFPAEHPKAYDPVTFETAWASGACLAVPRGLHEAIGGFDEDFFMYCEDVDLSWRARAHGFAVLINPAALFLHAVTNRTHRPQLWPMMLRSGHVLARKWGNPEFVAWAEAQLASLGEAPPGAEPKPVPESWHDIPDFSRGFSFSPVRW
ncbi:methyltransferase domain-containing protein [Paeniroseomonas aquatica]|uniref:Methyltransferase domain-containing protein n=1 Tax=Paeniroseomonas aquatica TaxID=373043 RepID=A0ABT8ABM3_9PROT|nr:methyltransferase domain-containing protein [Paeniroseomonas aquatica]MDN3567120.1 methyltransferase domain-containing protein [Paeniroseomonas aquatica]